MENIGPVGSYSEGLRAIKFLARLSKLPINFFGLDPSSYHSQLWVTYNKERHQRLFNEGSIGICMGAAELAGALDAWRCINRSNKRKPSNNRRKAKSFDEKPIIKLEQPSAVELSYQELHDQYPEAWSAIPHEHQYHPSYKLVFQLTGGTLSTIFPGAGRYVWKFGKTWLPDEKG